MAQKGQIIKNPANPCSEFLKFPLGIGSEIIVKGKPVGARGRFSINLCKNEEHTPDCALHFNPRFDQDCVVFNTMRKNKWGKEERTSNPFMIGQPFDVTIEVEEGCYRVYYGEGANRMNYSYTHRVNVSEVRCIHTRGDVTIEEITVLPNSA